MLPISLAAKSAIAESDPFARTKAHRSARIWAWVIAIHSVDVGGFVAASSAAFILTPNAFIPD